MADFSINDSDFEVGGKNKGLKQIQNAPKGFVVKDDIEQGYLNAIPLWHFGLLHLLTKHLIHSATKYSRNEIQNYFV
jgi:hypothetical protein